jgi:hypothetical protein
VRVVGCAVLTGRPYKADVDGCTARSVTRVDHNDERAPMTRNELVFQLLVGDAHQTFLDAVADFPLDAVNVRPPNVEYTFWHLVEHVRFCQIDMLDYLSN